MADDELSDEDKALFRNMVGAVTPLKKTKQALEVKKKPAVLKARKSASVSNEAQQYSLSNYYQTEVGSDTILAYSKPGIRHKRWLQLRQGKIPIEARLDLHGLTLDNAQLRLCTFIDDQRALGHRCLLIIHGKGGRYGALPLLKNHVNHWLPQLPHILAFHSALPRDGGSGAVYVLLAKPIIEVT